MRNLKIIGQTIFNNKGGKAVFAEQVYDRKTNQFQEVINEELRKAISDASNNQEILDKLQEIETRLKNIEDNIITHD